MKRYMKKKIKKKKVESCSCMDCSEHEVINDRDPHDWFCDDDVAVVCKLVKNEAKAYGSLHPSDWNDFKSITTGCRPYNMKKEATVPTWCPKKGS